MSSLSASILCALMVVDSSAALADQVVQINADKVRTASFDGWGCSLAWWANEFGGGPHAETLADLLFTTETVTWQGSELPGLGMNIVRYNIGGSGNDSNTTNGTAGELVPPTVPAFRRLATFWQDPLQPDPASRGWNWDLDRPQRNMMRLALDRGADQVELFSNSPPWWMCLNNSTAGSDDGGNNLAPAHITSFADYLAIVVQHARDEWNAPVRYIAPFNEPSANWWKYPATQEGCHFDLASQLAVISALRRSLDQRGLDHVAITSSDENDIDTARRTWSRFDSGAKQAVEKVNTHGYTYGLKPYRGGGRGPLREEVSKKKLWMSEYGESDASGTSLARSVLLDLNAMGAEAWVYWQPLDRRGWGLIRAIPEKHQLGPANPKWHILAHFTRHIRPGSRILSTPEPNSIVAYHPSDHTVQIVTINPGPAARVQFQLEGFDEIVRAAAWTTAFQPSEASSDAPYVENQDVTVNSNNVVLKMISNSINSILVELTQ